MDPITKAADAYFQLWSKANPVAGANNEYWHTMDVITRPRSHDSEHVASGLGALRAGLPLSYAKYLYEVNDFAWAGAYDAAHFIANASYPSHGVTPGEAAWFKRLLYGKPTSPFDPYTNAQEAIIGLYKLAALRAGIVAAYA